MKLCGSCNTEKDESLFGARKASPDGLAHKCKSCQKEYDRARLRDPKRMKMRRDYQKTDNGKAAHNKATKKWSESNTIKRACHTLVGNAVRDGRLIRKPCAVCGNDKVHGHHNDYSKPMDVTWLCDEHHNDWHKENGEGLNAN